MSAASRAALALGLVVVGSVLLAAPALARNAYVANQNSDNVSVIDTATNAVVGSPIMVGDLPVAVAITASGARAYVVNRFSDNVSVINTATNTIVGTPIGVGDQPTGVAITPDGTRAYVANTGTDNVSVIDTAANATVGPPIPVGDGPFGVAISPDGTRAYVANAAVNNVSVIDTATDATVGSPIPVGVAPRWVAITPDGTRAYVANANSSNVSIIDIATNTTTGSPISVGTTPQTLAITPDGARAYVTNTNSSNVSVIDTASNATTGSPIANAGQPIPVAITPDGSRAYVGNAAASSVSVIDTQANATVGSPITVGNSPRGVAITPNQAPTAAFGATRRETRAAAGRPTTFDAQGSSDPDGTITRYDWDFGDGTTLPDGGPTPTHTYATPGSYTVTLIVTDNEGCSTQFVFTGQTASCNGSGAARTQATVTADDVDPPVLTLSGKRKQRLAKAVKLTVTSNEVANATATGKLIVKAASRGGRRAAKAKLFKLKRQTKSLAAGTETNFKLKLSKKAQRAAAATLADGGRVKARLHVGATDQAGNTAAAKLPVKLTPPRKRG